MRILVIGSEGNIGTKLVPYLRKCGHEVFRCDQIQAVGEDYRVINIMTPIDLITLFDWFSPDVVFHLAAMVSRVTCEQSPGLTAETNLTGLNNIIQLCKTFDSRLIYFSTSEVYGNIGGLLSEDRECRPNNIYGLTKYLGESLVDYYLKNAVIVRPFMFYDEDETRGDHRSAMIRFCYHLSRKEKITVHKGSKRSWMHISDGVKVLEKLIRIRGKNIVNVGSDELISTEDMAAMICNKLGLNYQDYVIEQDLPARMTLEKIPDIRKQVALTGITPTVDINAGIDLVLTKLSQDAAKHQPGISETVHAPSAGV